MMYKEFAKMVKIADLNDIHKDVAETIGLENFIKLSYEFGGTAIYIPTTKTLTSDLRLGMALEEFDGGNKSKVCKKYMVSLSELYRKMKK